MHNRSILMRVSSVLIATGLISSSIACKSTQSNFDDSQVKADGSVDLGPPLNKDEVLKAFRAEIERLDKLKTGKIPDLSRLQDSDNFSQLMVEAKKVLTQNSKVATTKQGGTEIATEILLNDLPEKLDKPLTVYLFELASKRNSTISVKAYTGPSSDVTCVWERDEGGAGLSLPSLTPYSCAYFFYKRRHYTIAHTILGQYPNVGTADFDNMAKECIKKNQTENHWKCNPDILAIANRNTAPTEPSTPLATPDDLKKNFVSAIKKAKKPTTEEDKQALAILSNPVIANDRSGKPYISLPDFKSSINNYFKVKNSLGKTLVTLSETQSKFFVKQDESHSDITGECVAKPRSPGAGAMAGGFAIESFSCVSFKLEGNLYTIDFKITH